MVSLKGPYWHQYCFNIFTNNIDSGIKYTLRNSEDDTMLSSAVDMLERRDAIQKELDRLEEWSHVDLMNFNNAKCKGLHMGWGNP